MSLPLFTECVAQLAPGVQLVVLDMTSHYSASVFVGEWPTGVMVSTNTRVDRAQSRVAVDARGGEPRIRLWLNDTSYTLPWLELLKVADFLRLPIPLPVPLGEQVPA
ncbi:hypothetical protein [Rhodanobacter lindaniclasticus]